jgi:alkyldihydroxyacetonephosphate synthase
MRAFDPDGILNPGNLVPPPTTTSPARTEMGSRGQATPPELDRQSLLVLADGRTDLAKLEDFLRASGLTLGVHIPGEPVTVAAWLASGAPGARDRWEDPVDQLLAGLDARLADGRLLTIKPAPRRSVGPDLCSLFVGAGGRFGTVERAWLRAHVPGAAQAQAAPFAIERDPPLSEGETALVEALLSALAVQAEALRSG